MSLKQYNAKRDFKRTPEPQGRESSSQGPLRFVVHLHDATRTHYDLRLEMGGSYKSWAVPKGPTLNPHDQRLAVFVEDHPLEYGEFEGVIPSGNYGAGTVMIWDRGTLVERGSVGRSDSEAALLEGLRKGHLTFILEGQKLKGEFALVRLKKGDEKAWLLIKKRDEWASREEIARQDLSVKTGRSMREIAADAPADGAVWTPTAAPSKPKKALRSRPRTPDSELSTEPSREKLPRRLKPLIASRGTEDEPFDDENWLFEIHEDGLRAIAEVERGRAHLHSKQLLSFDRKFPAIIQELKTLPHHLLLDGEIVTPPDGSSAVYWVFDLLHQDGWNLRSLPLEERKRRLKALPFFGTHVRYRDHVEGHGSQVWSLAQREGAPSLLAKEARSRYTPGRTSRHWLKLKVQPLPSQPNSSLTDQLATPRPPVVHLTHLDKVYWPGEGRTKGDLIEYYRAVAPWLLPHLVDRPESLHRHPNGISQPSFFQKDMVGHVPSFVRTESLFSESAEKTVNYLLCQNVETLLYVANLGCIELNPWISRMGSLDRPDSVVIDLDPDDSNSFDQVIITAHEVRRVLNEVGAVSYVKTSGATGLHICVPTAARFDYDTSRTFAQKVCEHVHEVLRSSTSLERNPAKRRGKIYLDYMQNRRGQTLAAPYCVRPRPGAPVSTPLDWSELRPGLRPEQFHLSNTLERLSQVGDLWKPMLTSSVDLSQCLKAL